MKSALLICPKFFEYHISLKNALEYHNVKVKVLSYTHSKSSLKTLNGIYERKRKMFNNKVRKVLRDYVFDHVVVVNGHILEKQTHWCIQNHSDNCHRVIYFWDSLKRLNLDKDVLSYYDTCYSFDIADCLEYEQLQLKHLFCSYAVPRMKKSIDILFVASYNPERYNFAKDLSESLRGKVRIHIRLYLPFSLTFLRLLIYTNGKAMQYVTPLTISNKRLRNMMSKSKAMIDLAAAYQSGLTMRTVEALANDIKLVTNNENILGTTLYHDNNVHVFPRTLEINSNGLKSFLEREFCPQLSLTQYNIKIWIEDFL